MRLLDQERLTVDEAANLCGVHRVTAYRWLRFGCEGRRLPRYKIGGRVMVLRDDLERFVAETNNIDVPPPECSRNDDIAERVRRADAACEALGA